eukprot:Tbor_TRINITY_DN5118_c0_g1::TRINITY_DN5118_c0_g1_i1::g.25768::m.25768
MFRPSVHVMCASLPPLPPLACPGGNRMTSFGIKSLLKVSNAGQLSRLGQRFILNLKLTHQITTHLRKYLGRPEAPLPEDIGDCIGTEQDKIIIELGPGPGSLTRSLLTRNCTGVIGIEIDSRFNPYLQQIHSQTQGKFQWANGDVLEVDEFEIVRQQFPNFARRHDQMKERANRKHEMNNHNFENQFFSIHSSAAAKQNQKSKLSREALLKRRKHMRHSGDLGLDSEPGSTDFTSQNKDHSDSSNDITWVAGNPPVVVVANLPFKHATELLMRYAVDCANRSGVYRFGRVPLFSFFQKEIADRLVATPGSSAYGRPSVLMQNYFSIKIERLFSEETYYPKTNVLGALVHISPRTTPLVKDVSPTAIIGFLNICFKGRIRHKSCRKALLLCMPAEIVEHVLRQLKIDGDFPLADLSVSEICKMALLWEMYIKASNQHSQENNEEDMDDTSNCNLYQSGDTVGKTAAQTTTCWDFFSSDDENYTQSQSYTADDTDSIYKESKKMENGDVDGDEEDLTFDNLVEAARQEYDKRKSNQQNKKGTS